MKTRSRSKLRATNSPPRAVTVGGTHPETEVVVGLPLSATGQLGDGGISPRSSSLEAGPRRTYHPTTRSESAGRPRGPAQGVTEAVDQGTACLEDERRASVTTADEGQISTHIIIKYFENENIYKLNNRYIYLRPPPSHVTQFWGERSKLKLTRAHNVYR